jgi:hypothetical protein
MVKRNYNTTKREYRGALKAFKKIRLYLISIYFILETNIVVLIA